MQLLGLRTAAMKSRQMSVIGKDVEPLCFIAEEKKCTIAMEKVEPFYDSAPAVYLQYCTFTYSTDEREWKPFIPGETVIELGYRETALICARAYNYSFSNSNLSYNRFKISGEVSASGDVMSLITSEEPLDAIPSAGCFRRLFENCSTLIEIPTLSATQLKPSCYCEMFKGCSGFETAPELPATWLKESCYYGMFNGCEKLFQAPDLSNVKGLETECCMQMFIGCSKMLYAQMPTRDGIELATRCYMEMFKDCASIKSTSLLTSYHLVEDCYAGMFNGCSSLSYIATNQVGFDGCTEWVEGVSEFGCFRYLKESNPTIIRGDDGVPWGWKTCDFSEIVSLYGMEVTGGAFALQKNPALGDDYYFSVSYDLGETWEKTDGSFISSYSPVYIKGNLPTLNGSSFVTKGSFISVLGNIFTLLGENYEDNRIFSGFFARSSITNVPDLPAPTIPYQYLATFASCPYIREWNGWKNADIIPEGACSGMFYDCTGLEFVANFPANKIEKLGCSGMFHDCTSLLQIRIHERDIIDAYSEACSYMFKGCTRLKDFSCSIMRLNGRSCCLSMFEGCSSLTQSFIVIDGRQEDACTNMFKNCLELKTSPCLQLGARRNLSNEDYPARGQYDAMFMNCINLHKIYYNWAKWYGTDSWVFGVSDSGNFNAPSRLWEPENPEPNKKYEIARGDSFCPEGWSYSAGADIAFVPPRNPEEIEQGLLNHGDGLFFHALDDGAITLVRHDDRSHEWSGVALEFSRDNGLSWISFSPNVSVAVGRGDTIVLRAPKIDNYTYVINRLGIDENNYHTFELSGRFEVWGLVDSLTCSAMSGVVDYGGRVFQKPTKLGKYAYYRLFKDCVGLITAGSVGCGFNEDADYCYSEMYDGCINLVSGGIMFNLEDIRFPEGAFKGMFRNCKSLTKGGLFINKTVLSMGAYCCESMYEGCSSLQTVEGWVSKSEGFPDVTSTGCYKNMFKDTALTSVSNLPAMVLAPECYMGMFCGCSQLVDIPKTLPACVIPEKAYKAMFFGCESITESPVLNGTLIEAYGYEDMFGNCSKLSKITTYQEIQMSDYISDAWVYNVAQNGTFSCLRNLDTSIKGWYGCPNGWEVEFIENQVTPLCFTAVEDSCTISMEAIGNAPQISLEISSDQRNWSPFVVGNTVIRLEQAGDKVYFRTSQNLMLPLAKSASDYNRFVISGIVDSSGDVQSLLRNDYRVNYTKAYSFSHLFDGCGTLRTAPELTAAIVGMGCYSHMFKGCVSIKEAPILPALILSTACYESMFEGCSSLQAAPELIPNTVSELSYSSMFKGCKSLTSVPVLKSVTLKRRCYQSMFEGCTSLKNPPEIWAKITDDYCCLDMFNGCTSLKYAPELLSTEVSGGCYSGMFRECTSLQMPPKLEAMELSALCYYEMFSGCTSLKQLPNLPATELKDGCYSGMFKNCSSITKCESLLATTLCDNCYAFMFKDCSSLKYIYTKQSDFTGCEEWLSGVSNDGRIDCISQLGLQTTIERGVSSCPEKWIVKNIDEESTPFYGLCFTADEADSTLMMTSVGNAPSLSLMASFGGTYWFPVIVNDTIISLLSEGEKIYLKSKEDYIGGLAISENDYNKFSMTGKWSASGNLESLISYSYTLPKYCFAHLFDGCVSLNSAPSLSASELSDYCYAFMFKGCTSLQIAPNITSPTLARYCYYHMFEGCESLEKCSMLPAKELVENCYSHMFYGCKKLNYICTLQSSFDQCENWLYGVSEKGDMLCLPKLGTSGNINRGDSGCPVNWSVSNTIWGLHFISTGSNTQITLEKEYFAPLLNLEISSDGIKWQPWGWQGATPEKFASYTFKKPGDVLFIRAGDDGNSTLTGLAAGGTQAFSNFFRTTGAFYAGGSIQSLLNKYEETYSCSEFCFFNLFNGCRLLTAPELPATQLSLQCYSLMFRNCTELKKAPILPATNLAQWCYSQMFEGCSKLQYIETNQNTLENCEDWVNGVGASGVFRCKRVLGTNENITRGASACPEGWTVENIP